MVSVLISLGGDAYPRAPLLRHAAFARSSRALAENVVFSNAAFVTPENHLSLFNDNRAWSEQLIVIRDWLRARLDDSQSSAGPKIENVIVHYVGHGMFKTNSEEHYLSINATDAEDRAMTSASLGQLNDIMLKNVRKQRRIYLIDACFAAASIRNLMGSPEDAIEVKLGGILKAWPEGEWGESGVAALCSADKMATASAGGDRELTQFTDGLLTVLEYGDPSTNAALSLRRVHRLLSVTLRKRYGEETVHPVLVAPEDQDGGIAAAPIFPNAQLADQTQSPTRSLGTTGIGLARDAAGDTASSLSFAIEASGATTGSHYDLDRGMKPEESDVGQTDWSAAGTSAIGTEAILSSSEQRFREAAYRFFRLSHSKKNEIARDLDPTGNVSAAVSDLERYKTVLANVRDTGAVGRLEKLIVKAEGGQ